MKKNLPHVFKNTINKSLKNNEKVFYSKEREKYQEINIDELFKQNQIYRTDVKITLKNNNILEKNIIGRSINHLITSNNELIAIDDILKIEKK